MGLYEGPVSAAARLLLAAIFVWAGIHKILNPEGTMAYMTAYGLTVATMILYLCASLIEIGGGVALALGFMTREAAIMLVAFMIIVTAIFHARVGDPNQLTHFLKNTAMTGALLYVWAYGAGPWGRDEETAPDRNVGVTPELQGALALLGRMLLALIFVVSAVKNLMNPDAAQKYAAAMGLTGGTGVIVAVGILAEIGGAVLLVVGQWVRVGLNGRSRSGHHHLSSDVNEFRDRCGHSGSTIPSHEEPGDPRWAAVRLGLRSWAAQRRSGRRRQAGGVSRCTVTNSPAWP